MAPRTALRLALAVALIGATAATTPTAAAVAAARGGAAASRPSAAAAAAAAADLSGVASAAVAAAGGGGGSLKITPASALPSFVTLSAAAGGGAAVPVPDGGEVAALLGGAAAGATVRTAGGLPAVSTAAIDDLVRGVRGSTFREVIVKTATTLAFSIFNGRQTRFTFNVLVIRKSLLLPSALVGIVYAEVWKFNGVDHVVVLFRSGTLRHKAFGGLSQAGFWAERSSEKRGVVVFQTPQ